MKKPLIWLFVVLIAYILSGGPGSLLFYTPLMHCAIVFYSPLTYLAQHTVAQKFLVPYWDLWTGGACPLFPA